jgi:hypothetical protein
MPGYYRSCGRYIEPFVGVVGSDYCRRARRLWSVWGSTFSYRVEFSFGRDGVVGGACKQDVCLITTYLRAWFDSGLVRIVVQLQGSKPWGLSLGSCDSGILLERKNQRLMNGVIFCFSDAQALSVLHLLVSPFCSLICATPQTHTKTLETLCTSCNHLSIKSLAILAGLLSFRTPEQMEPAGPAPTSLGPGYLLSTGEFGCCHNENIKSLLGGTHDWRVRS